MANPEYLQILNQGTTAWNRWRQAHPDIRPDLSGADLTASDLRDADLRDVNLREAKLIGADLWHACLQRADLTGVDLRGAKGLTRDQIRQALVRNDTQLPHSVLGSGSRNRWDLSQRRALCLGGILLLISSLTFYIQVTLHKAERAGEEPFAASVPSNTTSAGEGFSGEPAVVAGSVRPARNPLSQEPPRGHPPIPLTDLTVTRGEHSVRIYARVRDKPRFKMFRIEHPNRVVIDIPDVLLSIPREKRFQELSHPLVTRLRIEQHTFDPPAVRLVLEVPSFPELQIMPEADGLAIRVSNR